MPVAGGSHGQFSALVMRPNVGNELSAVEHAAPRTPTRPDIQPNLTWNWCVSLVLLGWWPLLYLGPGRVGVGLVAVGLAMWLQLGWRWSRTRRSLRAWGTHWLLVLLYPAVLALYAAIITVLTPVPGFAVAGSENVVRSRLLIWTLVAIPMFIAGARNAHHLPFQQLKWLGTPLVLLLTLDSAALPATANPLLAGHAMWLTATAIRFRPLPVRLLNWFVVAAAVRMLWVLGEIGPTLSAVAVAALFMFARERRGTVYRAYARRVRRGQSLAVGLIAVIVGIPVAWGLIVENRSNPIPYNSSYLLRSAAYRSVLLGLDLHGHGLRPLVVYDAQGLDRAELAFTYAHNFLLDALHSTGVLAVPLAALLGIGIRRGMRDRRPESIIAMGLLASSLFSGGIESPHAWFGLGLLLTCRRSLPLVPSEPPPHSARAGHGTRASNR